jgi:photosystem II stability/assembly factor-like uncharacterized protein
MIRNYYEKPLLRRLITSACSLFVVVLAMGLESKAEALELKDRLKTPAKLFSNVEKSAFLDVVLLGGRLVAIGERGLIIYSDNGGETWLQAAVPVSTMLTSMHFIDDKLGWAVGHSAVVLHTQNGGESWTLQFDGNQANKQLMTIANNDLASIREEFEQATEDEQEDMSYDLEDAEFALSNAEFDSELGPANPLLNVWFESEKVGFIVGAYGLFFKTLDGGQTWSSQAHLIENFDRYHLNAIRVLESGAILLVGEAGTMFASYDQGEMWETLYAPYQGSFFGLEEIKRSQEVLVYGLKGNVYKSADEGQSWDRVEVPATTNLTGSTVDENGVIVLSGFSGVIVRSTDNGESFAKVKQSGLEAYNNVAALKSSELVLVSDKGVHFQSY